jgi:hypothetical protein
MIIEVAFIVGRGTMIIVMGQSGVIDSSGVVSLELVHGG